MFEHYFFVLIWDSGKPLSDLNERGKELELVPGKQTQRGQCFDPKNPTHETCPLNERLRPLAGSDGLFLEEREAGKVCAIFVQCTIADSHTGWHHDCFNCENRLVEVLKINIVESRFFFIIPVENRGIFKGGPSALRGHVTRSGRIPSLPDSQPEIFGIKGWPARDSF